MKTKTLFEEIDLDWLGRGYIRELYEDENEVIGRDIKLGLFDVKVKEKRVSKKQYEKLMSNKKEIMNIHK